MVKRRKFLVGIGSLAAGAAAATGTGAFNFANVERDSGMQIANGASAFLALEGDDDYATTKGNNGTFQLNFDGSYNQHNDFTGEGIQQSSDYSFTGVFSITNQGANSVGVWIEDDGPGGASNTVTWYGTDSDDDSDFSTSIEGPGNAYPLDTGETMYVNVVIETRPQNQNHATLPDTVNIKADASAGN